jgi:hypothetical protein
MVFLIIKFSKKEAPHLLLQSVLTFHELVYRATRSSLIAEAALEYIASREKVTD